MNNKFQKGDKVRIIGKSLGCPLGQSKVYKLGGGIGYIIRISDFDRRCILVSEKEGHPADFFAHEDLELYDDNSTKIIDTMFDDIINAL